MNYAIPLDELLSDRMCNAILSELVVIAGGQRGMTDERVPFAHWDMKRALRLALAEGGPPGQAPIITRDDVGRFTFRSYRKTVPTRISDEVLPAGTRVGTLEGQCVGSGPSRLAIDVGGNVYLVEEGMFTRSYVEEDASSPAPSTPS